MKKQTVIKRLHPLKNQLSAGGGTQLGLLGFMVRREKTAKSNIDIWPDFSTGAEIYPKFLSVCQILDGNFKRTSVDVPTQKRLSPYII